MMCVSYGVCVSHRVFHTVTFQLTYLLTYLLTSFVAGTAMAALLIAADHSVHQLGGLQLLTAVNSTGVGHLHVSCAAYTGTNSC